MNLELWMTLGKAEKIEILKKEEEDSKKPGGDEYLERIKEERTRTALSVKETWKSWREAAKKIEEEGEELLELPDLPDLSSAVTKESPGWSNTLPTPEVTSEKLGGGDQGGRGAYQEIRKESIAHHNAGLLSEREDQEDLEEGEEGNEYPDIGQDCRSFCDLCAEYPCLCDLLKLEMKLSYLSGSYVELEGRGREEAKQEDVKCQEVMPGTTYLSEKLRGAGRKKLNKKM